MHIHTPSILVCSHNKLGSVLLFFFAGASQRVCPNSQASTFALGKNCKGCMMLKWCSVLVEARNIAPRHSVCLPYTMETRRRMARERRVVEEHSERYKYEDLIA